MVVIGPTTRLNSTRRRILNSSCIWVYRAARNWKKSHCKRFDVAWLDKTSHDGRTTSEVLRAAETAAA